KPLPRSRPQPAPWSRSSRAARWCTSSCWPRPFRRTRGTQLARQVRHENGGSDMLVLSRKRSEAVVVGGHNRVEHLLKVTVLEIKPGSVVLGFEADESTTVHRLEVWNRIRAGGPRTEPADGSAAPPAREAPRAALEYHSG